LLLHTVKVYPSKINLPKKKQLAWKIAEIASDNAKLNKDAIEMVINRVIDNASVAIASLNRRPVISSREMALKHSRKNGATLFGVNSKLKFDCEWAAWSNGTAVRELDFHDTFLAADYSHPGDNIPPLLAVAQQNKVSGLDLLRGIITAYEVQVNLVKGICLHKHKVDHIAHLGPSVAAGLGSMLNLILKPYIKLYNKLFIQLFQLDNREKVKFQVGKLMHQHMQESLQSKQLIELCVVKVRLAQYMKVKTVLLQEY